MVVNTGNSEDCGYISACQPNCTHCDCGSGEVEKGQLSTNRSYNLHYCNWGLLIKSCDNQLQVKLHAFGRYLRYTN